MTKIEITPLHFSLGNRARLHLKKEKKKQSRNLFLTVLEVGKSKIKMLVVLVSGEGPVSPPKSVLCCCVFWRGEILCPHMVEEIKEGKKAKTKQNKCCVPSEAGS